jgi:hypothetical protein
MLPIAADRPDQRLTFATESYKEAMNNLRHYQTISFQTVNLALTGMAVFSGWLVQSHALIRHSERWALFALLSAFTASVIAIQWNCLRHSKQAHRVVILIDQAFQCFDEGAYLPSAALFPKTWARSQGGFFRRISTSLIVPLTIGYAISSIIIFIR